MDDRISRFISSVLPNLGIAGLVSFVATPADCVEGRLVRSGKTNYCLSTRLPPLSYLIVLGTTHCTNSMEALIRKGVNCKGWFGATHSMCTVRLCRVDDIVNPKGPWKGFALTEYANSICDAGHGTGPTQIEVDSMQCHILGGIEYSGRCGIRACALIGMLECTHI